MSNEQSKTLSNEQLWGTPDVCEHTGVYCSFWEPIGKKCLATDGCAATKGSEVSLQRDVKQVPGGQGLDNGFLKTKNLTT